MLTADAGPAQFRSAVWAFYSANRRDFPWRRELNPYRVLVSEIMLQQTQTSRVDGPYQRFLEAYPLIEELAGARTSELLRLWRGLGYNRRALSLRETAGIIVDRYGGQVPPDREALTSCPGIGDATAGAVLAYAYNMPVVFMETNIRRVFIHHFFSEVKDGGKIRDRQLVPLVQTTLDRSSPRHWYYALTDYGVYLKKTVAVNPNRRSSSYSRQSPFEGSRRQLRGAVVRCLLDSRKEEGDEASDRYPAYPAGPGAAEHSGRVEQRLLEAAFPGRPEVEEVLTELEKEGFIRILNGFIELDD